MSITVRNVTKRFGNFVALDNVSVDVEGGSLLALLGPSGSGKTTLLRVIAGLENADSGTIHYDDEDVTAQSARERNIGFVFQHYALFRHMTVFDNVAFGLKVRRLAERKVAGSRPRIAHAGPPRCAGRAFSGALSGGQRQRVALVRALAIEPKVLLLDEPFGALTPRSGKNCANGCGGCTMRFGVTSIFVTHDQEEAFEVRGQGRGHARRAGRTGRHARPRCSTIQPTLSSWIFWET